MNFKVKEDGVMAKYTTKKIDYTGCDPIIASWFSDCGKTESNYNWPDWAWTDENIGG